MALSQTSLKTAIKDALVAMASSAYHTGEGHDQPAGFAKYYSDPKTAPNGPIIGFSDEVLVQTCYDELVADGTLV